MSLKLVVVCFPENIAILSQFSASLALVENYKRESNL